jgi:hypothetical protein
MEPISSTEWLVLNATADDAENLEQIYRSIALEFSPAHYHPTDPKAYYWREARPPVLLSEIADAILSLVARGLLNPRWDPADQSRRDDLSYVWRAWFELSPEGRSAWAAMEDPSRQQVHSQ